MNLQYSQETFALEKNEYYFKMKKSLFLLLSTIALSSAFGQGFKVEKNLWQLNENVKLFEVKSQLDYQWNTVATTASIPRDHFLITSRMAPINSTFMNTIDLGLSQTNKEGFFSNRRNVYSSMWAFASLNYLYADLVGLMDASVLSQYQEGTVNGLDITPGFLTGAAAFMQIPLANVFLPQIIKNDKTLRWVQIVSGSLMTLIQGATLFVGKPPPYYVLFSAIEMGATTFITIDALKWNTNKKKSGR